MLPRQSIFVVNWIFMDNPSAQAPGRQQYVDCPSNIFRAFFFFYLIAIINYEPYLSR